MTRRHESTFAAVLALLVTGCPLCPDAFYEVTNDSPQVRLPLDEAPHCFSGTEWWYYTGRLVADTGQAFGIHAVIFHVPPFPLVPGAEAWVAHYAVVEVESGRFAFDQVAILGPNRSAVTPDEGFDLRTPLIRMRGVDGEDAIEASFPDGRYGIDLALTDTRDAVLHGGDGYVPYGSRGRSFYYSRPRMDAYGTLRVNGATLEVSGQMWFDRQWGLDLNNPFQPWDWFSLRLDDGTDIMLFRFPGRDDPIALGTLVPPSGAARSIAAGEFRIAPAATWVSPTTGVEYEVGWTIEIPGEEILLSVTAVVDDAEIDARSTTLNLYWEGLCTVSGWKNGIPAGGHAFVEQANAGL